MTKEKRFLSVAKAFTKTPGARYRSDGKFSGQEFYESHLNLALTNVIENNEVLILDLDNTYGYATSFISDIFSRVTGSFDEADLENHFIVKSEDDIALQSFITNMFPIIKILTNDK